VPDSQRSWGRDHGGQGADANTSLPETMTPIIGRAGNYVSNRIGYQVGSLTRASVTDCPGAGGSIRLAVLTRPGRPETFLWAVLRVPVPDNPALSRVGVGTTAGRGISGLAPKIPARDSSLLRAEISAP
jgi:hypothetical protein